MGARIFFIVRKSRLFNVSLWPNMTRTRFAIIGYHTKLLNCGDDRVDPIAKTNSATWLRYSFRMFAITATVAVMTLTISNVAVDGFVLAAFGATARSAILTRPKTVVLLCFTILTLED